jgi:uncharacterized membrane protein
MSSATKADWMIPVGLILLSLVPVVAGTARLVELAGGGEITPANARFFASPLPVVLHIVSVTIYSILGAFQFSPAIRRRRPAWHRGAGRVLIPCGLIAALSGLWMTLFYPWVNFDGEAVYVVRLLVGVAMAAFLCLGFAAIRRRDVPTHRANMIRAYALGIGAGTQVFTHVPYFIFSDIQGETGRAVCMIAGWAINILVAEWIIRRPLRAVRGAVTA